MPTSSPLDLDLSEELLDDPSEPDTVFKDMGRINQANIVSGTRTRNTQEEALIEQLGRLGITMEIEEKEKNATSELSTYKDWAYCDEQYRKMQEKRRRRFEDLEAAAKEDPKSLVSFALLFFSIPFTFSRELELMVYTG